MQPLFLFGDYMLKPNFIFKCITDISSEFLHNNNIKGLLLDVDNTMSVAHGDKTLREGLVEWLSDMKENGIELIVLSNAKTVRARRFGDSVGLSVVGLAAKPLPFGYLKAVKALKLKRREVAIVGDQIFTDILGGKLAGVKTLLVTDITREEAFSFRVRRKIEDFLLKRWKYER